MHLELWQDNAHENIFFTLQSTGARKADLDHYRFSEFFKDYMGENKSPVLLRSLKPGAF